MFICKSKVKKAFFVIAIVIACVLVILSTVVIVGFKILTSDKTEVLSSKSITTDYGDAFALKTVNDHAFPQYNLIMYVDINGDRVTNFSIKSFNSNYGLDHNFDRDFIQSLHNVLHQYQDKDVRIYEFYWGVVYSQDGGKTFEIIDKSIYEECYFKEDSDFKQIYDLVNPYNVFVTNNNQEA